MDEQALATTARTAQRAATVAAGVGMALFACKLGAWMLTQSVVVLSDALEGLVNVVAGIFAWYCVRLSHKPADSNHPYGHGKVEFVSAAFEGGLVVLAAAVIAFEASKRLIGNEMPRQIGVGSSLVAIAAGANLATGWWLIHLGTRLHSSALVADGKHLLTDVVTSVAALVALGLVQATQLAWIDPAIAMVAALNILRVGWLLLREAIAGIMDEADQSDLRRIDGVLARLDDPRMLAWGRVRSRHQGALHHVDLTLYVHDTMSVATAHDLTEVVEERVTIALGNAQVLCHVEPVSLRR